VTYFARGNSKDVKFDDNLGQAIETANSDS
jgi:hypothetical protein